MEGEATEGQSTHQAIVSRHFHVFRENLLRQLDREGLGEAAIQAVAHMARYRLFDLELGENRAEAPIIDERHIDRVAKALLYADNYCTAVALTTLDTLILRCGGIDELVHRQINQMRSQPESGLRILVPSDNDPLPIPAQICLDGGTAQQELLQSRRAPASISREAVLLQYAVDARLDQALENLYFQAIEPSLAPNPYCALVRGLRAYGQRMDLWPETAAQFMRRVQNDILLLIPQLSVYGVRDKTTHHHAQCAFGSYSAVSLVNVARLGALKKAIGELLLARDWHSGAYSFAVVSAVAGDAFVSGALDPGNTSASSGVGPSDSSVFKSTGAMFPFEVYEHTLASGPDRKQVRELYAGMALACWIGYFGFRR